MTSVLDLVLAEARRADGPLLMRDLAARMGIQESALRGIVEVLVRKGVMSPEAGEASAVCLETACRRRCTGLADCPFVAEVPASYTIISASPGPL